MKDRVLSLLTSCCLLSSLIQKLREERQKHGVGKGVDWLRP